MTKKTAKIVVGYAEMWPRKVFNLKKGKKLLVRDQKLLEESGVYILYREDQPYYVGQASGRLWQRVWQHANQPKDKWYNFWNFFSAFVVPDKQHIDEIEGILIAAMPTANSAKPKIRKLFLPAEVIKAFRQKSVQIDQQ